MANRRGIARIFRHIDDTGFNGDGSATFSGMTGLAHTLTGASLVDAGERARYICRNQRFGPRQYDCRSPGCRYPGREWYCSPQAFGSVFCRLSVTTGGMAVNAQGQPVFMGFPVVTSPKCPTSGSAGAVMLYFGNLRRCAILAQRHSMSVAASQQVGLERDQTWWRMTWRCAVNIHETSKSNGRVGWPQLMLREGMAFRIGLWRGTVWPLQGPLHCRSTHAQRRHSLRLQGGAAQ